MTGTKITRYISSCWFSAVFILAACGSYIYFSSSERPYEEWVNFLFYRPAGLIIYIGLIVNLISVSIRIVHTRLWRKGINTEYIKNMDTFITIPVSGDDTSEKVSEWIKKKGFFLSSGGDILIGNKGRLSFLPGLFMRFGLTILMTALIFSVHIRRAENTIFHKGDELPIFDKKVRISGIKSDLPEEFLQVGEENAFRLENISAVLSSSGNTFTVTNGFPINKGGKYYRIAGFGFSQALHFKGHGNEFSGNVDLDILPPGKTDSVSVEPDYSISFALQPEKTIKKGLLTGKQFDLRNLLYSVTIKNSKLNKVTEGITLKPAVSKTIEGYEILLGDNSHFVKIQSVYDPALFWVYNGMLLLLAAILLMSSRFFWYEKQICAFIKDGEMLVGYSEEYYKKWGIQRFQRWIEEIKNRFSRNSSQ